MSYPPLEFRNDLDVSTRRVRSRHLVELHHPIRRIRTLFPRNRSKDGYALKNSKQSRMFIINVSVDEFIRASQYDFFQNQMRWVEAEETQKMIKSSDDHVNFIAMQSIIKGCEKNIYANSFVGGPVDQYQVANEEQFHVALDSQMQSFARIKLCTITDGTQYLMWLGFAREATLIPGTCIYTTHGPPLKVPPSIYEAAPLLPSKFSVADMASIIMT